MMINKYYVFVPLDDESIATYSNSTRSEKELTRLSMVKQAQEKGGYPTISTATN